MATQPHSIHAPGSRAGLLPPSPVVRKYVNVFSAGHIDAESMEILGEINKIK